MPAADLFFSKRFSHKRNGPAGFLPGRTIAPLRKEFFYGKSIYCGCTDSFCLLSHPGADGRLGDISKQYTFLQDNVHTHSRQSMTLIRSWLSLYA